MRALTGVQESLAALRGWVVLGDQDFLDKRQHAWDEVIEPSMQNLDVLAQSQLDSQGQAEVDTIRDLLRKLKYQQWWIEDTAQTPGNKPMDVLLANRIDPIAGRVVGSLTSMIEMEKQKPGTARRPLLAAMADARGAFTISHAVITGYAVDAENPDIARFNERLRYANDRVAYLKNHSADLAPEQRELLGHVIDELIAYARISTEAFEVRGSQQWNIAQYRLAAHAQPLATEVTERLTRFTNGTYDAMRHDTGIVNGLSRSVTALCVLLMVGMLGAAWLISRSRAAVLAQPITSLSQATRALADGRLREDVPVTTDDEMGRLTEAFNQMRRRLEQRASELAEANRLADDLKKTMDHYAIVSVTDVSGKITYTNDNFNKISGYANDSLIGFDPPQGQERRAPAAVFQAHVADDLRRRRLGGRDQEPGQARRPLLGIDHHRAVYQRARRYLPVCRDRDRHHRTQARRIQT